MVWDRRARRRTIALLLVGATVVLALVSIAVPWFAWTNVGTAEGTPTPSMTSNVTIQAQVTFSLGNQVQFMETCTNSCVAGTNIISVTTLVTTEYSSVGLNNTGTLYQEMLVATRWFGGVRSCRIRARGDRAISPPRSHGPGPHATDRLRGPGTFDSSCARHVDSKPITFRPHQLDIEPGMGVGVRHADQWDRPGNELLWKLQRPKLHQSGTWVHSSSFFFGRNASQSWGPGTGWYLALGSGLAGILGTFVLIGTATDPTGSAAKPKSATPVSKGSNTPEVPVPAPGGDVTSLYPSHVSSAPQHRGSGCLRKAAAQPMTPDAP